MIKRFLAIPVFFVFCGLAFYGLQYFMPADPMPMGPVPATISFAHSPIRLYDLDAGQFTVIEDKIQRNEFLGDILTKYHVPYELIRQIQRVSHKDFDVRKIVPNKKYTVFCSKDSLKTLKAFVYEPSPAEYVMFRFDDSLQIDVCKRTIVTVEKSVSGTIESSLFNTIEEMGISYELTNKFVDIFGWQVDFQRLQKGDKFKIIYDEDQIDGEPIGIRMIKGIYFEHVNHPYYAFAFDQGDGLDYFDEEGKSLRKALLKYPIEFTRISSRYSGRRFHPVKKVYRAHLGTDFAAPEGTPIRAVGDGIVTEAQYKSNNGNYVKIRHNGTYTTQYLHMSRIASGIHANTHVRQGQTIGYVGSTGLATGPHLCYRFWKNDVQVDALRVDLPPSQPVKASHKDAFELVKTDFKDRLNRISFPPPPTPSIASLQ